MDWPHDPDGEEGSEGRRKYGMAILAKKVDEEDFPLSLREFAGAHGDDPIRINYQRVVPARDILEHVDRDEVESIVEFHRAIGRAMRAGDFWDYHPVGEDPEKKRA